MEILKNHPTLIEFRKIIFEDRYDMYKNKGYKVTSIEHSKKFNFLSASYFNNIENGRTNPSLETLLYMLDMMGYEINFVKKQIPSVPLDELNDSGKDV
jgi:hypothetical protein